jgi:magnesium transporter
MPEEESSTTIEIPAGETESEAEVDLESVSFTRNNPEWEEHLTKLIEEKPERELSDFLKELYPADIAYFMERFEFEDRIFLFDHLDTETQGELLLEFDESVRLRFIEHLSSERMAAIILEQESDAAADILSDLDSERISEVISRLPLNDRVKITELLSYPENTAGSLMAKEFAAVYETDTVQKAIQTLRRISRDTDDIYTIYVVDEEKKYRGHMNLKKLILSNPKTKVRRVMETEILPIPVSMDREEVANFFYRYNFISVPVVDPRGVMIGRITVDDIIDVIEEEANEDILRMGGVSAAETFNTPILASSLKRGTWLAVNLFTAFIASSVVRLFETTIEKAVILAALMPIVAGMGGNAAAQTMTVVIRNIALGELTSANSGKVFRREVLLGLLNGLSMGLLTGVVVFLITSNSVLGAVIASAMIFNLIIAAVSGTLIPLILQKLKIDPAIASSIFVTTFTDVLGFSIFLGIAYLALP